MSDDIRGPIISAFAGFFGVLVGTALVPWVRDHFSRRKAARYLAIRVVCVLDKYVDDCASVAEDYGVPDHETGHNIARKERPSSPSYPTDIDWNSIDHKVMYDLLSLPNVADKAAEVVDSESDEDSFFETRSFEYATLGLAAAKLAARLRKTYGIRVQERSEGDPLAWDPISVMHKQLQHINKRREARMAEWEAVRP